MIQITPGDLVSVESEGRFYYGLILDRVRLFGGNWTFVFHEASDQPLPPEGLVNGGRAGYHAFVDFIWAKRERRLTRIARRVATSAFEGPRRLKNTAALKGKAKLWFIYGMDFRELKRVPRLTADEAKLPLNERIDDVIMVQRVKERWTPEQDPRI
jgi:hypothetical protein